MVRSLFAIEHLIISFCMNLTFSLLICLLGRLNGKEDRGDNSTNKLKSFRLNALARVHHL